jgi:hypothetical protein
MEQITPISRYFLPVAVGPAANAKTWPKVKGVFIC